jgi:FkbM family methyltransferase
MLEPQLTDGTVDVWTRVFGAFPISTVLDVGAATGGTVVQWLGRGALRVHAVEPVPENQQQLRERFGGDARVVLHDCGISDRQETVENLNVFNTWSLMPEKDAVLERAVEFRDKKPFPVQFTTIDALAASHSIAPDFVKIDVDGYEAKALRGAQVVLATYRPIVRLELSYLPFFYGDCCECMIRWIYANGFVVTNEAITEVYRDSRAVMRIYPWDTSFDVWLFPVERGLA